MEIVNTQHYLARIGSTDCSNNFDGLKTLQEHHMMAVPFENLDVVVGRDINLDPQSLYSKVVEKRRGGYCFELNLLYAVLLRQLGFHPKPVLGRVWLRDPAELPPRNHLAHLVDIEGTTFVTDVGFGGMAARIPLDIHSSMKVADRDGFVRVIPIATSEYMVQRKVGEDWANQYSFEDIPVSKDDIEIANFYMSKSPSSHFYNHRFVGLFTDTGRVGLFENGFTQRVGTELVSTEQIEDGEAWLSCLESRFGLDVDFDSGERKKLICR